MYLLGECDHYLSLKRKFPRLYADHGEEWSLKEYGSLFVVDRLFGGSGRDVLEFGCGFSTFFSDTLAQRPAFRYTSLDKSNNELGIGENRDRFAGVVAHREKNGHRHVDGLLGPDTGDLPAESFDAIFSVSVVEHIDNEAMKLVAKEAARLLRPGGSLLNSVDIYHRSVKDRHWHVACREAGLEIPPPHAHGDWSFSGRRTTFLEQQRIRYVIYNNLSHGNVMKSDLPYSSQFATVLHEACKPS